MLFHGRLAAEESSQKRKKKKRLRIIVRHGRALLVLKDDRHWHQVSIKSLISKYISPQQRHKRLTDSHVSVQSSIHFQTIDGSLNGPTELSPMSHLSCDCEMSLRETQSNHKETENCHNETENCHRETENYH